MKRYIHRAIKWLWDDSASATVVLIAGAVFVINGAGLIRQRSLANATDLLYPAFVGVALYQLYRIRTEIKNVNVSSHVTFSTGDDFDDYLRHRLNRAEEVRVIHISSGTSLDREYPNVIDRYLKKGKTFSRIISDTANPEVAKWIWNDLKKYGGNNYNFFIYCLRDIRVGKETRTIGIMLIDEAEVCLGGGYNIKKTQPTICIRDPVLVQFFSNYYEHLKNQSTGIRVTGRSVDWGLMKSIFPDWEQLGLSVE